VTGRSFVLLALYAALPFVHFVADNPDYPVPLGRLALYFLICLAVLVGLTVLVARSHSRVERVATVVGLGFYGFGYLAVTVSEGLEILPVFGIGPGVFVVLALVLAAVLITRWNWVLSFFFVFALLMALGLAIQAVVAHTETRIGTPVAADLAFELTPPATTPDIYWFILDGYARGDVLEEEYGYAGQKPFLDDLQERGFSVSAEASSAYPMTHLSMASTLSLDYLEVEGGGLYVSSPYLEMIKGENVVVKTIEAWGYEYVHVDNGWGGARCPSNGRVCVRTGYGGEAEWEMLSVTPLADLLAEPMAAVESKRRDPLVALERLRNAGPRSPFFAQIHLINPHPPHFRGGVDCAQRVVPFDLTVPYGHTDYVEAISDW
jgi:hypothetical protein